MTVGGVGEPGAGVGGVTAAELRALVELSAALGSGNREDLRRALAAAVEVTGDRVEEALLQSYLFLGYPAALNAFVLWRELSGREPPPPTEDDPPGWAARGPEVCRAVYGGRYVALRTNVRALHPDLERWMVVEGYGKVLGRPGLPLPVRELCIVAILSVLDAPRQLHSHLRGALETGVEVETVQEVLAWTAPFQGARAREVSLAVWDEVRARWEARVGSPGEGREGSGIPRPERGEG